MKTQPSHRLFCPRPRPGPRRPFARAGPTPGTRAAGGRGCAGAEAGRPGRLGHSPLTLLGGGPGDGVSLPRGTLWAGPQEGSKVPQGGAEASKGKTEKTPPSLSPGPPLPSGQEAPGNLPSTRPPHTNTHKHTHTVHRGLAWRGWGKEEDWEKRERASRSGRKSCSREILPTHRSSETSTGRVSRPLQRSTGAEGRRAPSWGRGSGSAGKRGPRRNGETPELEVEGPSAGSSPDSIRCYPVWLPW